MRFVVVPCDFWTLAKVAAAALLAALGGPRFPILISTPIKGKELGKDPFTEKCTGFQYSIPIT